MMAIFIGSLMIMSLVGFGLSSTRFNNAAPPKIDIPFVVNRELTTEEIVSLLTSGKVIIEDTYAGNCTDCAIRSQKLQTFFNQFSNFAVIQSLQGNETSVEIIGAQGRIRDITDMEFTDANLMDAFCEMAIAQPRECLLLDI